MAEASRSLRREYGHENIKFPVLAILTRAHHSDSSCYSETSENWETADLKKDCYLAAVISSQTVKHEIGDTSEKHEATIANRDQRRSLAFVKRASPGFFCLSHSARSAKSSIGTIVLLSGMEDISLLLEVNPFVVEELVFLLADCMLFRTVNMWVLSRGSLNSLVA